MEVYIVYKMNYTDPTDIIGIFDSLEKANKCKLEQIEKDKKDGFIIDEEIENIEKANFVTMFYKKQKNWLEYYEINIEKQFLQ